MTGDKGQKPPPASSDSFASASLTSQDFLTPSLPELQAILSNVSTGSLGSADFIQGSSLSSAANLGLRTRHRSGTLPSRLNVELPMGPSGANVNGLLNIGSVPPQQSSSVGNTTNSQNSLLSSPLLGPRIRSSSLQSSIWGEEAFFVPDTESFGSNGRARSYSANNAVLKPADRQFLSNCSTIKEEQPLYVDRRTQSFSSDKSPMAILQAGTSPILGTQPPRPQGSPLLQDNVPENSISLTSTHTNPTLGNTATLLIINVPRDPTLTNAANFYRMLSPFGPLVSVRVVVCSDSNDLVVVAEFANIDSAVRCRAKLNYQELVPGLSCLVSFAQILGLQGPPPNLQPLPQPILDLPHQNNKKHNDHVLQPASQAKSQLPSSASPESRPQSQHTPQQPTEPASTTQASVSKHSEPISFNDAQQRFRSILTRVSGMLTTTQRSHLSILVARALEYRNQREFGLGKLPESVLVRTFDTPRLREIRKQLDANQLSRLQVEELALAMYAELPELSSDYLGNTIVQKLLENCGVVVRDIMVKELSPYLAQMGAHKNGTWAAQKMINTAVSDREKYLISKALKPYCTQLFNDQYANYVIHCVMRFGPPYNDFVSETMLSTFMDIARNRFGARATRTCMESDNVSKESVVAISAAVITWVWDLIQDPNGSLLVTWFLDTCNTVEDRHYLLAQTMCADDDESVGTNTELGLNLEDVNVESSRLVKACCSKIAHLSILKLLNHRQNLAARDLLLRRIFGASILTDSDLPESAYLVRILTDTSNGPTFICKTLSIPTLETDLRNRMAHAVRNVLQDQGLTSSHQHKRLCEEVGLKPSVSSTPGTSRPRTLSTGRRRRSRSRSSSTNTLNPSPQTGNGRNRFSPQYNYENDDFDLPAGLDQLNLNNGQYRHRGSSGNVFY